MSSIRANRLWVAAFGGAVGVLAIASVAWACTFQPRFVSLTDQAGPKGSTVTVTGQGAAPGGAIQLRWNGVKGPQLAAATADDVGSFTASATVPDVSPDIYSLVVVTPNGVSRAAFEVTPDAPLQAATTGPVHSSVWGDPAEKSTSFGARDTNQSLGGSSSNFDTGAALLGVGMVSLASAAGIAAVRRRRASATSSN